MKKKIVSVVMLMMMLMCVTEVSAQWSVTPEVGMNVTKYKGYSSAQIGFKAGAAVSYTFGTGLFSLQSGLYYVQRGTGKSFYGEARGKVMDAEGKLQDHYITFSPGFVGSFNMGDMFGQGGHYPFDMKVESASLSEESVRRDYLQLPVLARFNWKIGEDVKLHIAAGPYFAYGIGGKVKSTFIAISERGFSKNDGTFDPFKDYYYKRFDWGLALNTGVEVKRFTIDVAYDLGLGKQYNSSNAGLNYQTVSFTIGYRF